MTFASLRDLALDLNLWAHGVDITVRPEAAAAITTRGIWQTHTTSAEAPSGSFGRRQPRHVLAIPRADVSAFPQGLQVEAPDPTTGTARGWVVDMVDEMLADHARVVLVPDPNWVAA